MQEFLKKTCEEKEEEYKKELYIKLEELSSKETELTDEIYKTISLLNEEIFIPDMSIEIDNTIKKIEERFKNAGLSLYVFEDENQNIKYSDIGLAIFNNLVEIATRGMQKLQLYRDKLVEISDRKSKQVDVITPTKKFFAILRKIFNVKGKSNVNLTTEEKVELDIILKEYKEIYEEIWRYELDERITENMVSFYQLFQGKIVPNKNKELFPTLIKLGLEKYIPNLTFRLEEL